MQKQVIYPKFISRLFASTIDLFILSIITPFIMGIFSRTLYSYAFKDYIVKMQNEDEIISNGTTVFYNINFFEYITANGKVDTYLWCAGILTLINFTLMGIYFISFWKYISATPGKLLMGTRIVDAVTLEKPTTVQLFKRFLGYLTSIVGIWSILFTERRQALHDKMASTVVIKS
jgi:uncharacterized RDD family membrane protein YckC